MVKEDLSVRRTRRGSAAIDFEQLFDRSTTAILVAGDDRRYVDANPAALLLTGYTRRQLLARRVDDLVAPDAAHPVAECWTRFLETGAATATLDLVVARGRRIRVGHSSVANAGAGLHVSIVVPLRRRDAPDGRVAGPAVSRREREVLALLARGHDGPQIAEQLVLSPATVRTHVNNAMRKLGARTRAHAIALAIRGGVVDP